MRFSTLTLTGTTVLSAVEAMPAAKSATTAVGPTATGTTYTAPSSGDQRAAFQHLYSSGQIEWESAGSGSVAFVPQSQFAEALAQISSNQARDSEVDLVRRGETFTGILENYIFRGSCFGSGFKVPDAVVLTNAVTMACDSVLGLAPGGAQMNNGWAMFKTALNIYDDSGSPGEAVFKYLYNWNENVVPSDTLCQEAYTKIIGECTGVKGGSQGGTMNYDDDSFAFSVDPNQT